MSSTRIGFDPLILSPTMPSAAEAIDAFLRALGHDASTDRQLVGTGERVASLFLDDLLDGYKVDVPGLFRDRIAASPQTPLVMVHRIPTHVVCPHHLTIGAGHASIGYEPRGHIVGLGVLAKLVDAWSHRLTLQEDVGPAIVQSLMTQLGAAGAGCMLTLRHACLEYHGGRKRGAVVRTVSVAGSFADGSLAGLWASGAFDAERRKKNTAGKRAKPRRP